MQSRKFLGPLLAAIMLSEPLAAQAGPSYTVTVLGGSNFDLSALNNRGQVAGIQFSEGRSDAVLVSGGNVINLGSLGGAYNGALAVNRNGDAAGYSSVTGSIGWRAALYSGGTVHDLGTLGGESFALGINDAGQVVGRSELATAGQAHAFLYSNSAMTDLGTLGGSLSSAAHINNAGQVAGTSMLAGDNNEHAFLYVNGVMTDLGSLSGYETSRATDINNLGQVVGTAGLNLRDQNFRHAFMYSYGGMTDLGVLPGGWLSDANAINDLGQVVGFCAGESLYTGFLYSDGVMMDLNALIDPAAGMTIYQAVAINNASQILAWGWNGNGETQMLLLDPVSAVPEPGPAGMLFAGLGLLGLVAARRRAAAFLAPVLLLLAPLAAQAAPTYSVTVLTSAKTNAIAINDRGQVLGQYSVANATQYGFVAGASLNRVGMPNEVTFPFAINDSGMVVGHIVTADGRDTAFIDGLGGSPQSFNPLNGQLSIGTGINNAGQITGWSYDESQTAHAFLISGGAVTELGSGNTYTNAINNNGQVAGMSNDHAFLYSDGVMTDLGTLGGATSWATGINDEGEVIGFSSIGQSSHAFLYSHGTMMDLGILGDLYSEAHGINNLGQVVGRSDVGFANDHGFLYTDGVMLDLNALIDPALGWTIYDAADINNAGQIAANGFKDGIYYALRLDPVAPVPEPGSVAMLLAGLGMLGFGARRGCGQ